MENIFKRDKMYMSDGESFVITEFDPSNEGLNYTLDFNTKGSYSIFSNVYDTPHEEDTWTIKIDERNVFYPALLEFLSDNPTVVYHDKKLPGRFVTISLGEDNRIFIKFNVPYNKFNVVNIKISEQDPNLDQYLKLISSLDESFKQQKAK